MSNVHLHVRLSKIFAITNIENYYKTKLLPFLSSSGHHIARHAIMVSMYVTRVTYVVEKKCFG